MKKYIIITIFIFISFYAPCQVNNSLNGVSQTNFTYADTLILHYTNQQQLIKPVSNTTIKSLGENFSASSCQDSLKTGNKTDQYIKKEEPFTLYFTNSKLEKSILCLYNSKYGFWEYYL
ncbi:hypothetical protein GXP67_33430 [Rhodocytophaga rosea]|uniref:Uncharacterized protein n=1 Tax=Rhodocytophaga rosea TaxID=2704465 RepID=A0A6C0GTI2_9BACT|nr:hypothetical protein [Rhodocytophaga rosea]QHT71207.1 hypothetical protein GXP67_33430 [Rhodocytophaga rosea]